VNPPQISIVGAGIGGLAAALALQQRGLSVRVFEQARALAPVGAGVHISPNGMHVLSELGISTDTLNAFRPGATVIREYQTSEPLFETPLGNTIEQAFGSPFLDLHRADLHQALMTQVQANDPDTVVLNKMLVSITEKSDEVTLRFTDKSQSTAQVVIGADGVHSVVRASLFDSLAAEYTGHVAYRGLIATDSLPDGLIDPVLNIWAGPGKHVVAYYLRNGELLNYVAAVEEPDWTTESWTTRADVAQLADYFVDWHTSVKTLIASTPAEACYKWALLVRPPMQNWSTGRTTLLGDAAHPMVPYMAQGAVMAIEDAWVLSHYLATESDIAIALANYGSARQGRTAAVQRAAWEQGQKTHAQTQHQSDSVASGGHFAKTQWLYGYNVCTEYPLIDPD